MTPTPKEKAQAGLWLIKQAVLDLVSQHPDDGVLPDDLRTELGLWSPNKDDKWEDTLFWGIEEVMRADGLTKTVKVKGRNRVFPA